LLFLMCKRLRREQVSEVSDVESSGKFLHSVQEGVSLLHCVVEQFGLAVGTV